VEPDAALVERERGVPAEVASTHVARCPRSIDALLCRRGRGILDDVRAMRLLAPSTWPLAVKLSLALLVASLVPMNVIAMYNLRESLTKVEESAYENLELLAAGTADRIDQLVGDTRQSVAGVAGDVEVGAFLAGGADERDRLASTVGHTLDNVVRSNPDAASVMLLDRTGMCVASTHRENLGSSYAFRDYFRSAIDQESFTSELLTGSTSHRAGVYFARRVMGASGDVAGVAVLKLTDDAINAITESMHAGDTRDAESSSARPTSRRSTRASRRCLRRWRRSLRFVIDLPRSVSSTSATSVCQSWAGRCAPRPVTDGPRMYMPARVESREWPG